MVQQTVLLKFPCCTPVEHPTKMNKGRMNEVVIWIDLTEPSMSLAPLVLSCHLVNISEFTYITLKFNHLFRHSDISKLFPGSFISQKKQQGNYIGYITQSLYLTGDHTTVARQKTSRYGRSWRDLVIHQQICKVPVGCFHKWWYPTTMGFPTKNDHFGMFWGYPYFWKHPVFGFGGKELLGILVVGN